MRWFLESLWYLLVTVLLLTAGFGVAILLSIFDWIMRKTSLRIALVSTGLVLLVGLIASAAVWYFQYNPVQIGATPVSVMVRPGDTLARIADSLESRGVIRSSFLFRQFGRFAGVDRRLIVGRYDFSGQLSAQQVLERIARGEVAMLQFTIYEGAPIWKAAGIIARAMELDSSALHRLADSAAYLASKGIPSLEGYLFPSTYRFPWGTPLIKIVDDILAIGKSECDSLWQQARASGRSSYEIMTLASIIEAEAMLESEKPIISSVYTNRLKLRMRLDADPTVIYGLGGLDRPLLRRDLDSITPYNTYRVYGLPPTPINSPGLTAIAAAVHPATTEYLYFVADGSGGHRFSRSNDEHNRARADIKRARKHLQGK